MTNVLVTTIIQLLLFIDIISVGEELISLYAQIVIFLFVHFHILVLLLYL